MDCEANLALGLADNLDANGARGRDARSLIATVGEGDLHERPARARGAQQRSSAVAILNVGGMDDRAQQQTLRVYEQMPLLPLDLLARVIAMAVDRGPPFSALFTL